MPDRALRGDTVSGWREWTTPLAWALANGAAGAVGGGAIALSAVAGTVLFGVIAGTAQWVALRGFSRPSGWWIYGTAVGSLLAWVATPVDFYTGSLAFLALAEAARHLAANGVVIALDPTIAGILLNHLITGLVAAPSGLIIGLLQRWSGPPPPDVPRAWPGASALGVGAAGAVAGPELVSAVVRGLVDTFARGVISVHPPPPEGFEALLQNVVVSGTLFGLVYGAVTGIALKGVIGRNATGRT